MTERTVRHWLQRGTAPDVRPRRKYHSDFDAYAPYVLKRWQQGCHRGMDLWREIAAQGYPGSYRMVYRFLETLQTTEQVTTGTHRLPQYPSKAAIWLFMRRFKDLDEKEQNDLMAFRQASSTLTTTYELVQDFLQMVRHRQGDRLEEWFARASEFCSWGAAGSSGRTSRIDPIDQQRASGRARDEDKTHQKGDVRTSQLSTAPSAGFTGSLNNCFPGRKTSSVSYDLL